MAIEGDDGQGGGAGGAGDAGDALAALTGDAGGAPAGADGGEQQGDKPGGGDGGGDPWFASLSDDAADDKALSDRKWAENKKYADVPTLVKAMRGLETQLGSEKVPIPKSADDKEGWDRFFKAAGRPDAPDGYSYDGIEKLDPALTGAFSAVAHEAGLTQAQAKAVVAFNEAQLQAQETERLNGHRAEMADLRKTLGSELEPALETGLRAAERFGIGDKATLDALRTTLGPKKLIGMLSQIGKAMGEDGLHGGGRKDMEMTADKAETRKAELLADRDFQAKLQSRDKGAVAEWKGVVEALAQRDAARAQAA